MTLSAHSYVCHHLGLRRITQVSLHRAPIVAKLHAHIVQARTTLGIAFRVKRSKIKVTGRWTYNARLCCALVLFSVERDLNTRRYGETSVRRHIRHSVCTIEKRHIFLYPDCASCLHWHPGIWRYFTRSQDK